MKKAMAQRQISIVQPRRQSAWSRCCDKLGKRMTTAMRLASGWPSMRTPSSRESLRHKQRKLVQCRVPLRMLDTEQRLRKLTSMSRMMLREGGGHVAGGGGGEGGGVGGCSVRGELLMGRYQRVSGMPFPFSADQKLLQNVHTSLCSVALLLCVS